MYIPVCAGRFNQVCVRYGASGNYTCSDIVKTGTIRGIGSIIYAPHYTGDGYKNYRSRRVIHTPSKSSLFIKIVIGWNCSVIAPVRNLAYGFHFDLHFHGRVQIIYTPYQL